VTDISKRFGGIHAVDGVSWQTDAGQIRCIIGPNGAGKSTFFQLLVGRIKPDGGTIRFMGADISRLHPFERARLGLAVKPQTLGAFGELTVDQNIRVCLQRVRRGTDLDTHVGDLLSALGLGDKAGFLTKALSHGEKQWLGLGMAIATSPKLLLLDEPTAGMSSEETKRTVDLVKRLGAEGTSVLVVEHDMEFVRSLAVETTVFHDGRVFQSGSLADIEQNEAVRRLYLGQRGAAILRQ